jgi:hypothetical protein
MFIVPFLAETSVPANVTALAKEGSFERVALGMLV